MIKDDENEKIKDFIREKISDIDEKTINQMSHDEQQETIFSFLDDNCVDHGDELDIDAANEAFEEMHGMQNDELDGANDKDIDCD